MTVILHLQTMFDQFAVEGSNLPCDDKQTRPRVTIRFGAAWYVVTKGGPISINTVRVK